jgi:ATP/ADP translocase
MGTAGSVAGWTDQADYRGHLVLRRQPGGLLWVGAGGVPYLGLAFFLWVGIFNVTVIAQFWAFANDLYTPDQGKRLFAIVKWARR